MKNMIKKILSHLPAAFTDYYEWLFLDSSENQIRIVKEKENKFRSYTELKKHQKRLKRFFAGFFLSLFFLLVGLVMEPIFFPEQPETEIYVPNGKGDILLGNISKNQATVIFKTLDGANDNKPLATKATVEVYQDPEYKKLERRTVEDDYAVTHIILVDTLQEGKSYYIRIIVKDAAVPEHTKTISSWGDGGDPIIVYTTGDLIANCVPAGSVKPVNSIDENNLIVKKDDASTTSGTKNTEGLQEGDYAQNNAALQISTVTNENYLQPKNKVQTIISWNTNKPSNTVLIYSQGNSKEKTEVVINKEMQTKHAAIITSFQAGTTYYFKVKSVDENGNAAISEDYSLRTPKPQTTVSEKIVESFTSLFKQIKPR